MPSKPIGTAFAEIDLDLTKLEQGLKKVQTSLVSGTIKVEDAYKSLGIKSDQVYNMMRANAVAAVDFIKNKTLSSKEEIIRAEIAAAAKIKSINEQQFGVQTSMIDKLKSHWIAASVAIGTAVMAIQKVWNLAEAGAAYEEQTGILDNLARKYETTADGIVSSMEKASEGLIAKSDLMQVALGGIAKGLNPKQLIDLAGAANILGDAIGQNATTALKDLTEALETGRTRGLKNYLGTTLDLETAFGDLTNEMTAVEKAQAMYSLTMITAIELQKQQTKEVDSAADKMERLDAKYKNITLSIATYCKQLVVAIVDTFDFSKHSATYSDIADGINEDVKAATENIKKETEATKAIIGPYQAQIDSLKKILQARKDNEKATKDTIKSLKEEKEEYMSAAEYQSWYWETTTDMVNDAMEEREKALEGAKKETEKLTKDTTGQFEELQRAIEGWGKESSDAIVDFCLTGKTSFSDMIESMIADLMKMMVYQQMMKPLFSALSNWAGSFFGGGETEWESDLASAKGNIFNHGNVIPFRRGGVVSGPTIFPMAKGLGLMGEAGPEAVMPLKRTKSGALGVASDSGQPVINIQIINQSKSEVSVKESNQSDGMAKIIFLVKDIVSKDISGGGMIHNSLRSTFGAAPKVMGR
jgi:lambda family phage tail tape measure protein